MQSTEQIVQSTKQWTESKAVRKARKARLKAQVEPSFSADQKKNYVFVLKWGEKYSAEYVNKMHSMVSRNLTVDHEFVCFTENSKGIDNHITTSPLPNMALSGWWYKPWFLSDELGVRGTGLFLDLDLIVFKNINSLFGYKSESPFVIIRDFNRINKTRWDRMNSSVFRFKIGHHQNIYESFKNNMQANVRRFQGDQDFMYANIKKNYEFWPDEWIQSYKWEMRGRQHLGVIKGTRNFKEPGHPKILNDTKIAVFHGQPNMHNCVDEWPKQNWG